MFGFKRKDITPVQSNAKKQDERSRSSTVPNESELSIPDDSAIFRTPARESQTSELQAPSGAPQANRTRQHSLASMTSFKSFNKLGVKSKQVNMSVYDTEATRTGKLRNLIEVDVFLIDGEPYTAQISEIEAYKLIYRRALKMDKAIFHGIKLGWAGHPLIEIRTKDCIDIDHLPKTFVYSKSDFDKDGNEIQRKVTCEIRGVRDPNFQPEQRPRRDDTDDNLCPKIRWIKIEGTGYDLKNGFLEKTLDHFGERLTDIQVEVLEFVDSESEDDDDSLVQLATGNMSVKMELLKDIPQFVPLYGKRIKIYYRGISKSCTRCYHQGHIVKDCKNERVTLVEYVEAFMTEFPDFPKELYGRWTKLVEVNKRAKLINQNSSQQTASRK